MTLADYPLKEFTDEQDNNADGHQLPGLPREQWVTELEWRGDGERFAALEWEFQVTLRGGIKQ